MRTDKRKERHLGDRIFKRSLRVISFLLIALLLATALFLLMGAIPAFRKFGLSFWLASTWDPVREVFGALPVIFGTLMSSFMAVLLAAPLSIAIALFLTEVAPPKIGAIVGFYVELLAAIPSVVYGLWGIFVLAPFLRETVEPFLGKTLGFLPLFQGAYYGVGMLAAIIILAIMITPTIASISREVFKSVPDAQREAVLALGGTRWEMMRLAVVTASRSGLWGAITLGLGRAFGETMAVTMVIGNRSAISASLFAPAQTMASVIAGEYTEATSDLHLAALTAVGFTLLLITIVTNGAARFVIRRFGVK